MKTNAEITENLKQVRTDAIESLTEHVKRITKNVAPEIYLNDHDATKIVLNIDDQFSEVMDKIELIGDELVFRVDDQRNGYSMKTEDVATEILIDLVGDLEGVEAY